MSVEGAAGWSHCRYFHTKFPDFILAQNMHINGLEMNTIIVASKVWGKFLSRKKIIFVFVWQLELSCGDPDQQSQRELVFLQARWEFQLRVEHIRSEDNCIPDLLLC